MSTFGKALCILPFLLAAALPVWAMINDKRDLARRKQDDAEAADLGETDRPRWPSSAFGPGSIR